MYEGLHLWMWRGNARGRRRRGGFILGMVVARLMAAGVERYHADYSRMETTYYWPDGSTGVVAMEHGVVPMEHERTTIAVEFSAAGVEEAVRAAQRGAIMYPEFTRQVLAAGWRRLFCTNQREVRAVFWTPGGSAHGVVSGGETGLSAQVLGALYVNFEEITGLFAGGKQKPSISVAKRESPRGKAHGC